MRSSVVALAALALASCARPLPIHRDDWMLQEVANRYAQFFDAKHDPDPQHDVGILRPRFGLPAVTRVDGAFELELLERGGPQPVRAALVSPSVSDDDAAACARGKSVPNCWPLALTQTTREPIERGVAVAKVSARVQAPVGGYDLVIDSPVDLPSRVTRAVWLREDDPSQLGEIHVVQLTDLHVGKGNAHQQASIHDHLERVVADVNALKPDLVIVTGDVVNQGNDGKLEKDAVALLEQIDSPMLAVLGNHDHGFDADAFSAQRYGVGWEHFARAFHPYLHFTMSLGGWDFIGFDTGPSEFSPLVLTRGLLPETVDELRAEIDQSFKLGHKGVVLFSHAPSRALYGGANESTKKGVVGQMLYGGPAFEKMLLEAAKRGQRVLHLAGHTHWNDVFEARPDGKKDEALQFVRWDHKKLWPGAHEIVGYACLITTQSCSHSSFPQKDNARGYGFIALTLSSGDPMLDFHRYDAQP